MPDRASALIASDESTARWAGGAAAELGLSVPDHLEISYLRLGGATLDKDMMSWPHVRPRQPLDHIFGMQSKCSGSGRMACRCGKQRIDAPRRCRRRSPSREPVIMGKATYLLAL